MCCTPALDKVLIGNQDIMLNIICISNFHVSRLAVLGHTASSKPWIIRLWLKLHAFTPFWRSELWRLKTQDWKWRTPKCKKTDAMSNKKAVLLQRWPRDARYISRSWPVAEIWPFETIQDGGGGRHLEFIRIENSAIRTAGPENPILEQNMKWIGRPVAEISRLEIFPTWRWPPSWICSNRK